MAAKNFLKSKGQQWTEVRIDLDPAEREKMMALTRRTSVPQISSATSMSAATTT